MIEAIVNRCAGLDVHKHIVVGSVLIEQPDGSLFSQTCQFGTFRQARKSLCQWLIKHDIELVVMESTGNYWKSIHAATESAGIKTYVVNARHVKQLPGRKTDVSDSQWLASLGRCGLLKPSFVPENDLQQLRLISRHRLKLVNQLSSEKNRLQKVLDDAGIRLGGIVSDIDGVSAQLMIRGLIKQQPLESLLDCLKGRLKIKRDQLRLVLDEPLSDRHRFLLQQIHQHMDFLKQQIDRLEQQLLDSMQPYRQAWQHLQTIPGIDRLSAAMIIAEIGIDMSQFGSADRLASWAGLCPGQHESAGKRKSTRSGRGNRTLRQVLCEAAQAASKTRSQFQGKYQTLVVRRGHKRSIVAIAHKLLRVIYFMLERQQPYRDPEIDYEALMVQKNAPRWIQKLKQYGYLQP